MCKQMQSVQTRYSLYFFVILFIWNSVLQPIVSFCGGVSSWSSIDQDETFLYWCPDSTNVSSKPKVHAYFMKHNCKISVHQIQICLEHIHLQLKFIACSNKMCLRSRFLPQGSFPAPPKYKLLKPLSDFTYLLIQVLLFVSLNFK